MAHESRTRRVCFGFYPTLWEILKDNVDNKSEWINELVITEMIKLGYVTKEKVQEIMQ